MKAAKGVDDLAAHLTRAATAPLVTAPAPAAAVAPTPAPARTPARRDRKATPQKDAVKKEPTETMQLTLRPTRALYGRYVAAAADRSRQEGRIVSVQEIMIEILEKGTV
ncbi:hypothetical protein CIW54_28355 (plasmid) [Paraburkholderia sp. T12-10]|nr:hypothetical protein CIW54_28355 [Paraburkholderia sp. T12-10]